jgi:hypothetical protein
MITERTLCEELKILPRLSRAQIARELIESLEEPESINFLDLIWGEEAERRLKNIKTGVVKPVSGKDVLAKARKLVNEILV